MRYHSLVSSILGCLMCVASSSMITAQDFSLKLRKVTTDSSRKLNRETSGPVSWKANATAVIICDVWDYHHSYNAVQRLEEMLPRMHRLVAEARDRGAIIIHAPSDCMDHYAKHPARSRAMEVPSAPLPSEIASWCPQVDAERLRSLEDSYPLDQTDGGDDDDPTDHRQWVAKLTSLGRNPSLPWKAQSSMIEIDSRRDYISDKGDEVWRILKHRNIEHVLMVGVHTNMCVIGRPFGLRQMVANKMDVVLVRDMTDCMYNPKSWPFVDHFTGNDLMVAYIEQFVCPTCTSDQILGGEPFRFQKDQRKERDILALNSIPTKDWRLIEWQDEKLGLDALPPSLDSIRWKTGWLRCSLRFADGARNNPVTLKVGKQIAQAWLNGKELERLAIPDGTSNATVSFAIPWALTYGNDDPNLLVVRFQGDPTQTMIAPTIVTSSQQKVLKGFWEVRSGESDNAQNIALPAKFGLTPRIFHTFP